ncbi:MAG TPA: glycoside hydrolase family 9 protein [Candidatus Acidoferrum sp.]|nr:glycoside hydrolase family 9 protein [Candidatus Acidoferrum sp.]
MTTSTSRLRARLPIPSIGLILLTIFFLGAMGTAYAAEVGSIPIKVDQVGYLPGASKVAVVTAAATTFEVKRASDNVTVFKGTLGPASLDADSGDSVQIADFTKLRQPGTYYLDVPGVGRSWAFSIRRDVFLHTYYLAMRAFYSQRCGTAVDLGTEFPGYTHAACHLKGEFHSSSGKQGERDNIGGWHDAGDYGRYVVNSGITTGTLLWTWEIFGPKVKSIKLNIPESGNGAPDILNEIRWNLEWMLNMQDEDGGAWHKQTSEHFPAFVMPEDDRLPSEVIGTGQAPFKSTCATADLAAVAAIAARVYQPFDAKFAARNLAAARKAWLWTEKYPNVVFKNPQGVDTGEYGDTYCGDERLWAAAELWRTTGDAAYDDFFVKHYPDFRPSLEAPSPEGWREVAALALWTYALSTQKGADATAVADIRKRTAAAARTIVERTRKNPYRVSLLPKDYVWGSNGVVANYGMELLVANVLAPDPSFVETAQDNLHYLLGRNTFSISWMTQVGANPCHHPHHRPSGAGKNAEPWPGLLSGGPNAARQDDALKKLPPGLPPAKVYVDDQASYASNEIAINWQAPLVFLLAGTLP